MVIGAVSGSPDEVGLSNASAFEDLFRDEYRNLVRLAWFLLSDRELAEEAVQDAFLGLHRKWDSLRDEAAASAYLRNSVVNLARSQHRRGAVRRRGRGQERLVSSSAEDVVVGRDGDRQVLARLAALPRRQRECLVCRFYLDLSERDTANLLGITPGSVKSHTHRGLAALGKVMEDTDDSG